MKGKFIDKVKAVHDSIRMLGEAQRRCTFLEQAKLNLQIQIDDLVEETHEKQVVAEKQVQKKEPLDEKTTEEVQDDDEAEPTGRWRRCGCPAGHPIQNMGVTNSGWCWSSGCHGRGKRRACSSVATDTC